MKKNLLFLCTGNSCRSQMAEAWLRHLKSTQFNAYSAGIEQHGLNAMAVQVMAEVDVDMSSHHSKSLDDLSDIKFNYVITVCGHAHETCPYFPGSAQVIHVGFDDPPTLAKSLTEESEVLDCYRRVRDEIKTFVKQIEQHLN
ncbi:arsenate reductase ArsC [Marinicella gelatinilytica]|uniref:arsenate reductase ArsC n=1 Tax=Marinicella gelatinilytica TaxID=2996017 RepID=UPI002260B4D3|nr:arsenate reductase ArsC [Marinicella gelatinilytica]MCX7543783.1 arsenate reductase ArsC [Marinicella gelatinilytica]